MKFLLFIFELLVDIFSSDNLFFKIVGFILVRILKCFFKKRNNKCDHEVIHDNEIENPNEGNEENEEEFDDHPKKED